MKYTSAMRRNSGISLITAIFLLLVLAALATYIVSISTVQHTTSALDVLGSRAYQAARSGLEFGAFQAITNNSCAGTTQVALGGALVDFSPVTVLCTSSTHTEGTTAKTFYQITARACNQPAAGVCPNPAPGANYVERELQMSVISPP